MRTSYVIIVVLCIGIFLCINIVRKNNGKNDSWPGLFLGTIFGFVILALIINAASPTVYTINGTGTTDYTKAKFFLFYNAQLKSNDSKLVFLAPYGNNCIQNNTGLELAYHPIEYGEVRNHYRTQQILPHSINKIEGEPSFFFQRVPSRITYSSRYRSSGKTKWVLLKQCEIVQYKETRNSIYPL